VTPGNAGLYQLNLQFRTTRRPGNIPLTVTVAGFSTPREVTKRSGIDALPWFSGATKLAEVCTKMSSFAPMPL
jgi:hypothetical protein